jgi:hypothetical protein
MEPSTGIRTWQWVVTVIVIIILIIVGVLVFGKKGTTPTTTDTDVATDVDSSSPVTVNRIVMSDQFPGNKVYLSSLQLAVPAWVVIQKDNAGKPGEVIGSAKFNKGLAPGQVELSKSTVEGGTYYATLYADDGSATFDITKATALKDANGTPISRVFKATSLAGAEIKG